MQPRITFFCELDSARLEILFSDPSVMDTLGRLNARLSLGLVDMAPVRARLVQRLNEAGVPVDAWLLLHRDQGYWLGASNFDAAEGALL